MRQQEIINKVFPITFLLFPISLLIGPMISEVIMFFLIIFFLIQKIKINNKKLLLIFSLFFVSNIISSLLSEYSYLNNDFPSSILKSFFHLRFLLFFLITILILHNEKYLKIFKVIIILCLLFLIFDTLIQSVYGKDIFGFEKSDIGRLSGPFKNEYIVGGVILKFYLIYFCVSFNNLSKINKELVLFLFISNLSLLSVLLSGERSSIALFSFLFIFSFIHLILKNKKSVLVFVLTVILFLPFYLKNSNFMLDRFNSIAKDFKSSTPINIDQKNDFLNSPISYKFNKLKILYYNYGYSAHYYSAYSLFKDNIFFGVGQRNYRIACKNIESKPGTIEILKDIDKNKKKKFLDNLCTTHPHQTYFEILSETGLLGLIFFSLIIIYTFINIIKSKNRYLLGPLVIIFFPLVPTGSFFNNFNSMFLWTLLGIIHVISTRKKFFSVHKSSQLSY